MLDNLIISNKVERVFVSYSLFMPKVYDLIDYDGNVKQCPNAVMAGWMFAIGNLDDVQDTVYNILNNYDILPQDIMDTFESEILDECHEIKCCLTLVNNNKYKYIQFRISYNENIVTR